MQSPVVVRYESVTMEGAVANILGAVGGIPCIAAEDVEMLRDVGGVYGGGSVGAMGFEGVRWPVGDARFGGVGVGDAIRGVAWL